MVRVREIPRTAAFSWSPGTLPPLIATGTRAGAVDADFSNETTLELWDLSLDSKDLGPELLQPAAKIGTDSGFYDLAWTGWEDTSRGVIAGALQSGALSVWNADKLLNGDSEPWFAQVPRHSGPVKTLQFNPLHPNILATAGAKAEVYITNLNDVDSPVRLGNAAARPDDIDCLDWNKRVPHILVTGSNAGFVTVWDVKTKRESLTLNNLGRKAVSAVAWDPEKPTRLITSIPLETDPHILVWDLRNANAPERVLKGHDSGVLSLSWCRQDPSLLLSCGMDNRSLIWNPQTGENYGEFPVVTNWTFQTRFNPHNPNFFGTASFDGKIAIQTLQNTQNNDSSSAAQDQPVNDEDFFSHAQSQVQMSTFSLPKAPRWLERPVSASFGFGGRVIAVGLAKPGTRTSKITINKFEVDSDISAAADRFENALKEGDLQNICQTRAADAKSDEEKGDWKAIQALTAQDPRKQLIDYLGVSNELDEAADTLSKLDIGKEKEAKRPPPVRKHKRLQSMFDTSAESEQFFNEVGVSKAATTAVADDPFHIYTGSESDADRGITHALLFGKFDAALDICLKEDRLSDAFMVAICGGPRCIEKAQKEYLSKQASGPSYIRLLSSIAVKNLIDIVQNADLSNWKEVFATTCTFADDTQFPELCEILGDRLEELAKIEGHKESRRDASFCYIVSSKLDKAVPIWIEQLKEDEMDNVHSNPNTTSFSIHIHALQSLIEKVTIFRWATKYEDTEKDKQEDWKLSQLYDTYLEYSNIVASHGRLDVAAKYLDLMPQAHPDAQVAKERIVAATRKPAPQPVQPEPAQQPKTVQTKKTLPAKPITQPLPTASSLYQPPMSGFSGAPVQPAVQATPLAAPRNPYSNIAAAAPANPYAQVANTPYQPTRPASIPPPPTQAYAPPASAAPVPPPPRASSQSPATHASASAWNDLPDSFIKPVAPRRGTPGTGPAVISSPFPGQSTIRAPNSPPVITSPAVGGGMAVPPPPKGPAPMRVASPPNRLATPPAAGLHPAFQPQATPPRNPYAPPVAQPPAMGAIPIPQIPRGPSPFAAPPAQPTPPNRYTPSPAPQNVPSPAGAHPFMPPRSSSQGPYTPSAQVQSPRTSNPYTPSNPPVQRYPPPPTSTISHSSQPSTSSQPEKRESLPPRHPPGDRSHISPEAQPIFDILSVDMQRVKARAPSSFKAQVNDTERRLNILFDHLNNGDLLKPQTVQEMVELAEALQNRDYATAHSLHLDILTNRTDECGNWMVGVKRLIGMSRATP